jgi:hypothetical protein
LANEVAAEIEALVGPGAVDGLDFEAIESAARRQALHLAARAIERRFNCDTSDHTGPTLCCACGQPARYAGRRNKTFTTALGEMTLSRAYYHCEPCARGFCPRDQALGMSDTSLSPAATRMVGKSASMLGFAESSELMHELAGLAVEAKQVERTAEALGREIARDERAVVEPAPPAAATIYLGMDGTGVPLRRTELAGRKGKQSDGSAKTREVKLVTVWTAESRDEDGTPVRDAGSVSYSAAIESAATADSADTLSDFAQRVDREARRRGFDQAPRRVVLDDGKIDEVLAALRVHADANDEARKCVGYVTTNRQRLRYPEFRTQGLCTSTGVVEAGCKTAVGTRLKRAGMHWSTAGADAIIALRCCMLSGRFEDFWERRSATPAGGPA